MHNTDHFGGSISEDAALIRKVGPTQFRIKLSGRGFHHNIKFLEGNFGEAAEKFSAGQRQNDTETGDQRKQPILADVASTGRAFS